jgi:hypothetical protein
MRTSIGRTHGAPFVAQIQRPDFCSILNGINPVQAAGPVCGLAEFYID